MVPPIQPIARAIVCSCSYDDPPVIRQARVLLGPDRDLAWATIGKTRIHMLRLAENVLKVVKSTEIECLGSDRDVDVGHSI